MEVERAPIRAGDYVRYNGHVAEVTGTRLTAEGEHILTISGTGLVGLDPNRYGEMQVACDRTELVPDARISDRRFLITDDLSEPQDPDVRQRAARWHAQYTARPDTGLSDSDNDISDAEYSPDEFDFKDERGW